MTTITEDYVSFEIAKLLKEKGFNEGCMYYYPDSHTQLISYMDCKQSDMFGPEACIAPTLQMAMKWLREVHNIIISPYALSLGYYFEIFDLTNRDITGCKPLYIVGIPNKEEVLNTYEKACDVAIKYCLENLI